MRFKHIGLLLSLWLAGCMVVGPDYHPPTLQVPRAWQQASASQPPPVDQWWLLFEDKELNRLMTEATQANLDVKQALSRIKDARAQRLAILAAALPSTTARSNASQRLNNMSSGSQNSTFGGGFGVGDQLINIFQSGFDAQWELDFFGGALRAAESADATVASELESSRDVLITLQADVARQYMDLRVNQQLAVLTHQLLSLLQESKKLAHVRHQSGLAGFTEVIDAENQLATVEAQLPVLERDSQAAIHALSILLAKPPSALQDRLVSPAKLPTLQPAIFADLPAQLLQRRPDIRRAERQLAAANAAIGAALSELYPKVNLSAFLGLQNTRITDVTPLGKSWSTAASLTLPIFDWGRLNANVDSKKAQTETALAAYQATVLKAFKEVEDALLAINKEQHRQVALENAVAAERTALSLTDQRYQAGLIAFDQVLVAQQAVNRAESEKTNSLAVLARQQIALFKALGGGWQKEKIVGSICENCQKPLVEQVTGPARAFFGEGATLR